LLLVRIFIPPSSRRGLGVTGLCLHSSHDLKTKKRESEGKDFSNIEAGGGVFPIFQNSVRRFLYNCSVMGV